MKNIKVLVAYHKLDEAISSSVYQPIQLGRSLAGMESKDGRLSDADKAEMKKKVYRGRYRGKHFISK